RCGSTATPTRCSSAWNRSRASPATPGGGAASSTSSRARERRGAGSRPTRSSPRPIRHAMAEREFLERLEATLAARRGADPATSYVAQLHARGEDQILKKIAEEAIETVIASKSGDRGSIVHETADLIFHCLVMLSWHGIKLADVIAELERREGRSGLDEKASRTSGDAP